MFMKLFIYGAGGAGIEIYDLVMRNSSINSRYSSVYFIDDFREEIDFYGSKRIRYTSCEKYMDGESAEFVIAVGEPSARKKLRDKLVADGRKLATLIDENTVISDTAKISEGCIINCGAIISSNVVMHPNCLVMFYAIIGHDAVIESDVVICPKTSVGGNGIVGEQSFIGIGASIIQRVNVGKNAVVGMGAMVFREVEDNCTAVGNPARVTKGNDKHKVFK